MKKIVFLAVGLFMAAGKLSAQTLLYSHTFDGISINSWVMNETQTGMNYWTQNNTFAGSPGNAVPDVPPQPVTFEGGPYSNYMHITSIPNCNGFVPVSCNANYSPGDSSSNYTEMLNSIPTTGEANVTLSFWYLCEGEGNEAFGQVEYTVNNGGTWNPVGPQLYNTSDWTQLNITDPAFDNQPHLKFRFRWLNTTAATGGYLSLAVDEITITGEHPGSNSIAVIDPSQGIYCAGESINLQVDAPGPFNAGNVFTAELSNATGSFASPVAVGTLASTGGSPLTITATLPLTSDGASYRIRVTASDPATTGTDNGGDLIINPLPTISITSVPADAVICFGQSISMTASGAESYSWTPAVIGANSPNALAAPSSSATYTVTGTSQYGCSANGSIFVTVEDCASLDEVSNAAFTIFPTPASELMQVHYTQEAAVKTVEVRDMNGRVVFSADEPVNTIDVKAFTNGVYTLRVVTPESVFVQQFVRL